ncbi:MAG: hypothetical protein JW716_05690 [Candidatus Aenigmarchaeota archaeon]|nr:hypothetical protein [Candidatus Aenigmarchaeota archaeon]
MVCYIVPLAALFGSFFGQKIKGIKSVHGHWLNLMLLGASVFGGIDHMWNGELFMMGANIMTDLALGFTITTGVFASWGIVVYKERLSHSWMHLGNKLNILK